MVLWSFACHFSLGQTLITNYTSSISCTIASDGYSRYRPEVDVSVSGTNYLVLSYRQWKNGNVVWTNKYSNNTWISTNYASVPNGGTFIFRFNNSNSLTCVYSNTNGHSHYAGGVFSGTNKVWLYYAQPAVVTNIFTTRQESGPRVETNIITDFWGTNVAGMLTTTNNGTNWNFTNVPGSGTPGYIVEGGSGAQALNIGNLVIVSTNSSGKIVFNLYRVP